MMNLVLFDQAMHHVARISRILQVTYSRTPRALLEISSMLVFRERGEEITRHKSMASARRPAGRTLWCMVMRGVAEMYAWALHLLILGFHTRT